jgi:hypothetical protein
MTKIYGVDLLFLHLGSGSSEVELLHPDPDAYCAESSMRMHLLEG